MLKVNDKRVFSQEGFLIADAILTRTGWMDYTREELGITGGDPKKIVKLHRSRKALEAALPTMAGAAVTIGHPGDFLNPHNTRGKAVGAIAGAPRIDEHGHVRAAVRLWDAEVIDRVQRGLDELSPGFVHTLSNLTGDSGEIEGIQVNHIAVVPRGRAGHKVRILDHLPPEIGITEGQPMPAENKTLTDAMRTEIADAVTSAIKTAQIKDAEAKPDTRAIADAVAGAIGDRLAKLETAHAEQVKQAADAEKKKAEDAAKERETKIRDEARAEERQKFATINAALPYLSDEDRAALDGKSTKEILLLAVGDAVPNADKMSEERLRGIIDGYSLSEKPAETKSTDEGLKVKSGAKSDDDNIYAEIFAKRNEEG